MCSNLFMTATFVPCLKILIEKKAFSDPKTCFVYRKIKILFSYLHTYNVYLQV